MKKTLSVEVALTNFDRLAKHVWGDVRAVLTETQRSPQPSGPDEKEGLQGPAIEDLAWDKDRSSFEIAEQYGTESEFTAAITTAARRTDALKEAMHYAAIYGQDGPVAIYEVTRRVIFPEPPQGASGNQATARSDKHETETGVGVEPRPQDRQEATASSSSEPSASGGAVQRAAGEE